jgi:hypothetical protein
MLSTKRFTIQGISPLMPKNGQTADPLNAFALQMKKVSGKRNKTEADHEEMSRIEFFGSLYVDDKGHPCVPGENIEAMFKAAAKKIKKGQQAKSGIMSDGNWPILYNGPKNAEALWKDKNFIDRRGVVVQRARVMRTHPIFKDWGLEFDLTFDDELLDEADVDAIIDISGRLIGLCDYRPKFGRFVVI